MAKREHTLKACSCGGSEAEVLERSSEGTNISPGAGSSLEHPWERFPQRGISMHHFDVFKPTTTKGNFSSQRPVFPLSWRAELELNIQ